MKFLSVTGKLCMLHLNAHQSRAALLRKQERLFRRLIRFAYDNSEYYRKAFEEHGLSRADLATCPITSLPTLDKHTLTENFDTLVTKRGVTMQALRDYDAHLRARAPGNVRVVHSSGSTGRPCYFVYDNAAWETMLSGIIRGALWGMSAHGILRLVLSRPRVLYVAEADGLYGGSTAVGDGIRSLGCAFLALDVKTPVSEWDKTVRAFKPGIVIGYPSALKILTLTIRPADKGCIKRVVTCGEPLTPGVRSSLEAAFACPVINFYGASESLAIGVDDGSDGGMTLFDDLNKIEVEHGAMYLTCLYNLAMPLIRYRITDELVLRAESSDTPFTRAALLLSRENDVMWFTGEDGHREPLHPLSVEGFCVEGLSDYQFIQKSDTEFEVLSEVRDNELRTSVRAELSRDISKVLAEKHLRNVRFSVEFTDCIAPSAVTGKKSLVVILKKEEAV